MAQIGSRKTRREAFSRLPLDQQADCAFVPFITNSRKSRQTPSAPVGKRNQLAACPAPPLPAASPSPLPTVRGGHDIAQCSSEATEYDDRLLYGRNVARDSVEEGATALTERNEEEEDGGSCSPRENDGDDEYMDVGDENMQDQNMLGDDDVGVTSQHGLGDIPTGSVGAVVGRPLSSPAILHSQGGSQGGHDSQEHGGSKSRKRTRETSPSASAHKRQSRTDAVNEARGTLIASQEARPPRKSSQGGRSGDRGGGRGGARKGKQIVRAEELRDSGDEGEGVGPHMPDDGDEPLQHAAPIDTTRCFFLEYDERGFAKQKVLPVLVDVMKIKHIPRGNILFNHRSLSANIVRGIENVIESSITTEPRACDRPELMLAPVDRNEIVGGQGRRITPTEFFERDSSEFDWYAVCGQHTVEGMKTLVKKGSPAVDIYGLRAYSKVRVVYFGDDQMRGYFNVSAFDNTRENRAMMLSFEDVVRYMRQWWIDNHRIEALKGKVSDKDAVAVAHQKKWQNFLRASMGKACDKAFVKDMFHKLGPKRLKVWEYLFRDMPQGRLDGKYIYRKAKATETLKHYHGALMCAFETFVARCEILKFDLHKDQLTSKDYAELAKSGDGFNPVDSEEDSSDSDLELGEDTCAEVLRGGMVQAHDDGTVHSHEGSIPVAAPSVASMVAPWETAALQDIGRCGDNEEDDIEIPGEASTLAPGDAIPPGYWQSEAAIKAKAEELFHVLCDNRQLEYSNKFYALRSSPSRGSMNWKVDQTARTLEGSCSHDFMPLAEPSSVAAQAGHREDDGTTVVEPQEVDMTSMPQISEKSISVAAAQLSPPIDVSTTLPLDAGATYGSLLITNAVKEGTSEIESESDVGPSVAESQLQPSLRTGKGDAQSPLTPQGGAGGDGGKGGDVEGMHHSRNLDTLTADID
ncbi:hypothetical protein CBR_g38902 [Chara braunii]|uniref:Uncharacterized protein n=1 Tax=Chara braunii TaxID=69332 RepID=A0A388LQK3_CHABU|nr:hypothetical protein CBR_g38902 [Chara braunii]|eukprot:GBG84620.1 hypothetical protein CBR_g38902 [Chara braunii]